MRASSIIFLTTVFFLLAGLQKESQLLAQTGSTVKGIVYHDKTGNGSYEPSKDSPLRGIAVSNGREVVLTDRAGKYELPLRENSVIFVIKPRNWIVPVDENQLPRFYYVYSPRGVSGQKYAGMPPTGLLPEYVNFPLYPYNEPDSFDVLVFGDTQPRDDKEVYYMARDVLPEVIGVNASFGITLGDIVFDKLELFDHLTKTLSAIGIPMRYVAGNHDIDFSGNNLIEAQGEWLRTFGPTYYSFSHGPAHFIILNNIRWIVEGDKRYYRTGLGEDQMEFLRNEIKRLSDNQLLVLLSHIPYEKSTAWESEAEKKAFYELIASHANTVSMAAHTHRHYHDFLDKEWGFPGNKPHHMVSVGTVCGAWWTGAPDEYGIPHAMMSDGTPNCYTILHVRGNEWKLSWKAAGRSADFQMHIDAPDYIISDNTKTIKVIANIFNALPSADVRLKIGEHGEWLSMKRNLQHDPFRLAVMEREKQLEKVPWRSLGNVAVSEHIWVAEPEINLGPGVYVIYIEAKDDWWEYEGRKLLRIK